MAIIANARRVSPRPEQVSEIYIDESSQTRHRYLVLGGLIIASEGVTIANAEISRLRLPELPHGEMKWTKVSNTKLMAYKRIVDGFFDRVPLVATHFHSIVVDTWKQNHGAYNGGDREIGFNKEIYQLASKFARLYPTRLFHLYPDHRETNQRPEELRLILNRGRNKASDPRDWPFRRCHFRDSRMTPLLQLVDILSGAIAFHANGHINAPDASEAKKRLSNYVLRRAGVKDVMRDTSMSGKFTIWHRKLR